MLIANGTLRPDSLAGQVAVVTGAGGGIGYETARALIWLGARPIIAELDAERGRLAEERLCAEFGPGSAAFIQTDVGDEASVEALAGAVQARWGGADIVFNNATLAVLGAVKDAPVTHWDRSYRVNLRGPVLLARAFLPGMIERGQGTFVCVSSSGAAPYMGPYEVFKTAQVELANTLSAEVEGTGVIVFTIGPGLVATETFLAAARQLAPLYGKTVDEFRAMSQAHELSAEAAGAGFAASLALAPQFAGQEISSIQALVAAGIDPSGQPASALTAAATSEPPAAQAPAVPEDAAPAAGSDALALCRQVLATLQEQSAGWKQRSLFERQWTVRDFKKNAGMPVEGWLEALAGLERCLADGDIRAAAGLNVPLPRLAGYYEHMYKVADGYLRDPRQRAEQLPIVRGWQAEVERLIALLGS